MRNRDEPPAPETATPAGGAGSAGEDAVAQQRIGAGAPEAPEAPEAAPEARSEGGRATRRDRQGNMLPGRDRRRFGIERLLMRLIATFGIVGIGVALGAILASSKVQGWIIGLVVAGVSVVLSAILWSSRQL